MSNQTTLLYLNEIIEPIKALQDIQYKFLDSYEDIGYKKWRTYVRKIGIFFLISGIFVTPAWSSDGKELSKYGPVDKPIVIPLSYSHDYFQNPMNLQTQ